MRPHFQTSTGRRPGAFAAAIALILAAGFATARAGGPRDGVSPSALVRPSGPGSIQGFGATYEWMPALNGGSARYSVSIKVPPGAGRAQPNLSIVYDSGRGDGPLGRGWRLEMPGLRRRSDRGLPAYPDAARPVEEVMQAGRATDPIVDEAGEELVETESGDWFREHESTFVRYRRLARDRGWVATFPDGSKLDLGADASSRIEEAGTGRVYAWLPSSFADVHGNTLIYRHKTFPGDDNTGQKYLDAIEYGAGPAPWTDHHFVRFEYEPRHDPIEDARGGFPVRTGMRLKRILVGVVVAGSPERVIRSYVFRYADRAAVSLLASIGEIGDDGATALPLHRFFYAAHEERRELSLVGRLLAAPGGPPISLVGDDAAFVDLNADGLPDLLRTFPGGMVRHQAFLNLGEIGPAGRRQIAWGNATEMSDDGRAKLVDLAAGDQEASLIDFDGDGKADLAYRDAAGDLTYLPNRGKLSWGGPIVLRTAAGAAPPTPRRDDPGVRTVDLDGDHRLDLLQGLGDGSTNRVWLGVDGVGFAPPRDIAAPAGFDLRVPSVHLADMNGDGVMDLARIDPEAVTFAPGLGFGRFGAPRRSPALDGDPLTLDDQARAKLSDVDGDGLADLVVGPTASGRLSVRLNRGFAVFSSAISFRGLPALAAASPVVRWADMNGNGSTDLVIADPAGGSPFLVADLGETLGAVPRPDLLRRIENGRGLAIELTYETSTKYALEDERASRPWPRRLPFPIAVVAAATITDGPAGPPRSTLFRYHNGAYDPVRREFLGFGIVDVVERGEGTARTLVTRTAFDQGFSHPALRGKTVATAAFDQDGRLFHNETIAWSNPPRTLHAGLGGRSVRFAYPIQEVQEIQERGEGTPVRTRRCYEFDEFGNATLTVDLGTEAEGDERLVRTSFAIDKTAWLLHAPRHRETTDGKGRKFSSVEWFYDDPTFAVANRGTIVRGDITMVRSWIASAGGTETYATIRRVFDRYGNTIRTFDPMAPVGAKADPAVGHYREVDPDPRFHRFPTVERIAVGNGRILTASAEYDVGYGTVTAIRDFAGARTSFGYDPLGRLAHVLKPGDPDDLPTVEYAYEAGIRAGDAANPSVINAIEVRLRDRPVAPRLPRKIDHYFVARQYLDGVGRVIQTKQEAEPDPRDVTSHRAIVLGAIAVDSRGKVTRFLQPCFSTDHSALLSERLRYEDMFAKGWEGEFFVEGTPTRLDLAHAPQSTRLYDALLREVAATHADGSTRKTRHLPLVTELFDENQSDQPAGLALVHRFDGLGRLAEVSEKTRLRSDGTPAPAVQTWTTAYAYDPDGELVTQVDSQGNCKTIERDGLGRVVKVVDPDFGTRRFEYDAASNLSATIDAAQRRTTYTHDGANRLLSEDDHDGTPEFEFDPTRPIGPTNRPDVEYGYDDGANAGGRVVRSGDRSGSITLSYDERGRQSRVSRRIAAPSSPERTFVTAYEYDTLDRPTALTFPDGDRAHFSYNARNLPESIRLDSVGVVLADVSYEPSEHRRSIGFGNGVTTSLSYDARARLKRSTTIRPGVTSPSIDSIYEYSAASDLLSIVDKRTRIDPKESRSESFRHDDLHRLVEARYSFAGRDGKPATISYRHDSVGNLIEQISNIGPDLDLGALGYGGTAGPHALTRRNTKVLAAYDANGDVVARDGGSYRWDFDGRLMSFADPARGIAASYGYDHSGRRTWKRVATSPKDGAVGPPRIDVTLYVGEHFEVRPNGVECKHIFSGDRRIVRVETKAVLEGRAPSAVLYDHDDHLGSTAFVTDVKGAVVAEATYYPFGEPRFTRESRDLDRGFLSAERDSESRLIALPARMLWGATGRFLSPDPALLTAGSLGSPQSLNPYAYAANRPVTHSDPDGNFISTVITLGFAAYDTYHYSVGNLTTAQYAGAMALNGAALLADVSTGGMGGGLILGAVQAAKVVDRVATGVSAVNNVYSIGKDIVDGNYKNAAYTAAAAYAPRAAARYLPKLVGKIRAGLSGRGSKAVTTKGDFFEVLNQQSISGHSRSAHRATANKNLHNQLVADPKFNQDMSQMLGVQNLATQMSSGKGKALLNPAGTEWHHPIGDSGSMNLLRKGTHRNPELQDYLHPNQVGGFGKNFGP